MTQISPKITAAQFLATIQPGCVSPLSETLALALPLNFGSVACIGIFNGTYTPNNDYRYIFQNLPEGMAPNFVIVISDAQLNIARVMSTGGTLLEAISRFAFFSIIQDSANFLTSLYLEGRTAEPSLMPQNMPVNYTIITGQALIT